MTTLRASEISYVLADDGVRYAYRRLGPAEGVPLVMHGFFRSNMDFWDPALVDALAAARPVILFDQAGVGRTTGGAVATTFHGWASCQLALTAALGLDRFDVLGFSMGGAAAQMVALTAPHRVRKLVLAGTTPAGQPPGPPTTAFDGVSIVWPRNASSPKAIAALSDAPGGPSADPDAVQRVLAASFFYDDAAGRAATRAYWDRVTAQPRREPALLEFLSTDGAARQLEAVAQWRDPGATDAFAQLRQLEMPVLVLNGDNDAVVPSSLSWELAVAIPRAQLVIYPRAGHGFIYQHAELVAAHVNMFLDGLGNGPNT